MLHLKCLPLRAPAIADVSVRRTIIVVMIGIVHIILFLLTIIIIIVIIMITKCYSY